jgi:hypothetical protein
MEQAQALSTTQLCALYQSKWTILEKVAGTTLQTTSCINKAVSSQNTTTVKDSSTVAGKDTTVKITSTTKKPVITTVQAAITTKKTVQETVTSKAQQINSSTSQPGKVLHLKTFHETRLIQNI